jgi:tetratricopeptide (TPR) repeat protein
MKTGGNSDPSIIDKLKESKTNQLIFAGLLIIILVLTTYRGASKNGFVDWDDNEYVENNNLVKSHGETQYKDIFSTVISLNYHPLTMLSMRLNNNSCKTCPNGISAKPFIRGNITLHVLNSVLVLLLIFSLSGRNITVAFLVAAIFGVHPMHVESVAWVSERKDVLYSFFFLSGLLAYLKYLDKKKGKYLWLVFSFILFVLSCLSKATAVVFPVVLILLNFWVLNRGGDKSIKSTLCEMVSPGKLVLLLPFFVVSLFFGIMTIRIQSGHNFLGMLKFVKDPNDVINIVGPVSTLQHFQLGSYGFFTYIIKFFLPVNLSPFYPYPSLQEFNHGSFSKDLWMAFFALLLVAALTIWSLRKTKLYFFSLGFYFITIVLVLQFMSVGTAVVAERYSYLPYIGLAFLPATLIANTSARIRNVLLIISGCFIIVLMILSRQQIKVWFDSETLWSQAIARHPNLELPRKARGKFYYMLSSEAKNPNEKKKLEEKAMTDFTVAIKAGTKEADVYEGTGVILEGRGDLKNALVFLNKAISIDPKKGRTYYNRAMVLDGLGRKEDAIKDYSVALIYQTDLTIEILSNRAVLFMETEKFREAISDLDYLISEDGNNFMYYYNRAFAKLKLNDIEGAIADYRKVLQLNPGDKETAQQLQILIDSQGR